MASGWRSRKITPKTAERYGNFALIRLHPTLARCRSNICGAAEVERWHSTLKASGRKDGKGGLSALTIRHAHRLLSKALKEAARHDLVVRNVAAVEQPPKVEREEIAILTGVQTRDVVQRLRGQPLYVKVIVGLFTGMRRGEILALRWSHVNLDAKTITVREAVEETRAGLRLKTTKTNAGKRDITLPDIVVEALRDHRREQLEQRLALGLGKLTDDALLFSRLDGSPQSPHSLSKEWHAVAADLGLSVTFHALRHTHASVLIDAGIGVVKISKRLGHAKISTTLDVYSHLFVAREDKSAQAINDAVTALFLA